VNPETRSAVSGLTVTSRQRDWEYIFIIAIIPGRQSFLDHFSARNPIRRAFLVSRSARCHFTRVRHFLSSLHKYRRKCVFRLT
jgi:hypothetical protein